VSLLKKYNVQGPRYTSYPTVPYWDKPPTQGQWIESIGSALEETLRAKGGAAVYMHIPFCQSLCSYCGCNTRITKNHAVGEPYVETLLKEWSIYQDLLGSRGSFPLLELHLGGGTPTFLKAEELKKLLVPFLSTVNIIPGSEFSIEADPRVTTLEQLKVLYELGFRRLSLGIQDFDPVIQKAVNRIHDEALVKKVVDDARSVGFNSINFDLIYGLPFQTLQSIEGTIQAVQRLRPDRIAFYAYAHVPWIKPAHRKFTEADLPAGETKRSLYELGRSMLESSGYQEMGMDHFALKTDALYRASAQGDLHRNFMGYTSQRVAPLIGLGVSSIGDSWNIFAQNEKLLEKYQEIVSQGVLPLQRGHTLNPEDLVIRHHLLNLTCRLETEWSSERHWTPWLEEVPHKLREPIEDGLVEIDISKKSCKITDDIKAC
jgi:oxygen-independent coproporphyrinogen-3 oxidase